MKEMFDIFRARVKQTRKEAEELRQARTEFHEQSQADHDALLRYVRENNRGNPENNPKDPENNPGQPENSDGKPANDSQEGGKILPENESKTGGESEGESSPEACDENFKETTTEHDSHKPCVVEGQAAVGVSDSSFDKEEEAKKEEAEQDAPENPEQDAQAQEETEPSPDPAPAPDPDPTPAPEAQPAPEPAAAQAESGEQPPSTPQEPAASAPEPASDEQHRRVQIVTELCSYGIPETEAYILAQHPDVCERQMEHLKFLGVETRRNPGGWLRVAIEKDHGLPTAMLNAQAEKERQIANRAKRQAAAAAAEVREQEEKQAGIHEDALLDALMRRLSAEEVGSMARACRLKCKGHANKTGKSRLFHVFLRTLLVKRVQAMKPEERDRLLSEMTEPGEEPLYKAVSAEAPVQAPEPPHAPGEDSAWYAPGEDSEVPREDAEAPRSADPYADYEAWNVG